jgi:Domain of unknown function (DUF4157)
MFAPPIRAPQANPKNVFRAGPTIALQARQRMARLPGSQAPLRILSRPLETSTASMPDDHQKQEARQSMSWDFSKIPVVAPGQPNGDQTLSPLIQPKLMIGQADDPLEQEANRVADRVMRMPAPEFTNSDAGLRLSRKCAACEGESDEETLQSTRAGWPKPIPGEAPGIVHQVLRSSGRPLEASTRAYFEPRFGFDFSRVRVHSDGLADEAAAAVNAKAYTVSSHLVFAAGQYVPHTQDGKRLLAHELAHVVQQRAAGTKRMQRQGDDRGIEQENEANPTDGDRVVVEMEGSKTPKRPPNPCTRSILAEGSCADLVTKSKYICCDPDHGITREGRTKDIDGVACPSEKFTPIFTCDNTCDKALAKGCDDNDNWMAMPGSTFTRAQCGDVFTICADGKRTTGYVRDKSVTAGSFEVSPGIQKALGVTVGSTFNGAIYRPTANQKAIEKDPCCNK